MKGTNEKMRENWYTLRSKLFRFTHALILPLSILVLASIIYGIGNILIVTNSSWKFGRFLFEIGQAVFDYMPFLFGSALVIYFVKLNKVYGVFVYALAIIIFYVAQHGLINYDENGNLDNIIFLHKEKYHYFLIKKTLTFNVLNTGYFGTFCVAIITIYAMNHWSDFTLPKYLAIFNKEKCIPFILVPVVIIFSLLMLIIWPFIGSGLSYIFVKMQNFNFGFDGFFYGVIKTSLKPFGFHYIFSSMVLNGPFGGVIEMKDLISVAGKLKIWDHDVMQILTSCFWKHAKDYVLFGEINILNFILDLPFDDLPSYNQELIPIFDWFHEHLNINIGKFTQNYSLYFGAYPSITIAIILSSPKEKRKKIISTVIPALLIAFFVGVSEPFEFLLLFAMPLLYFVLYVPLVGFSLMFIKLFDVNVGSQINSGLIDFISYGIIPVVKNTKYWIIFALSAVKSIIAFVTFYFMLKLYDFSKITHSDYNAIYFTKKQYNHLINIGFSNEKEKVNQVISLKKQLQNYILTNIQNGNWKPGEVLPSEKALAIKFNCSRLTARNALITYVSNGLLISKKGQGYFINKNYTHNFVEHNNQKYSYQIQMCKLLSSQDVEFSDSWINNHQWQSIDLNRTHNIEKKYFDNLGKLKIYEISILNKTEFYFLNSGPQIDDSWMKSLTMQGIDLTKNYSRVIIINNKYRDIAQELGWNQEYPLIISVFAKNENWVEISLKIISKTEWEFSRYYQIIK